MTSVKPSKLKSILTLKCPQCRQGDLFTKKGLFVYSNIIEMPENCSVCEQKFEIEPGFWIGALWTSYPIVILIGFPFLMLALFNSTIGPWISFSLMLISFVLAYPSMLRLGRSIWISTWVKFKN